MCFAIDNFAMDIFSSIVKLLMATPIWNCSVQCEFWHVAEPAALPVASCITIRPAQPSDYWAIAVGSAACHSPLTRLSEFSADLEPTAARLEKSRLHIHASAWQSQSGFWISPDELQRHIHRQLR